MEIVETNNNAPSGRDLANKYGYPTMSVDNIKAVGTDPYNIPDRDLPPVLDPYSASERSKSQIPSLSERIKNTVKTNYYDNMKHMSPWDIWLLIRVTRVDLISPDRRYR